MNTETKEEEMDVYEKINRGHYNPKVQYPTMSSVAKCSCGNQRKSGDSFCSKCGEVIKVDIEVEYQTQKKAYNDSVREGTSRFKKDALEEVGLTDYECADRAYSLAWSQGHASGFSDVMSHLQSIAYVITG